MPIFGRPCKGWWIMFMQVCLLWGTVGLYKWIVTKCFNMLLKFFTLNWFFFLMAFSRWSLNASTTIQPTSNAGPWEGLQRVLELVAGVYCNREANVWQSTYTVILLRMKTLVSLCAFRSPVKTHLMCWLQRIYSWGMWHHSITHCWCIYSLAASDSALPAAGTRALPGQNACLWQASYSQIIALCSSYTLNECKWVMNRKWVMQFSSLSGRVK